MNDFVMIHGAFAKPETVMYIAPTWASLKMKLVTAVRFLFVVCLGGGAWLIVLCSCVSRIGGLLRG